MSDREKGRFIGNIVLDLIGIFIGVLGGTNLNVPYLYGIITGLWIGALINDVVKYLKESNDVE